MDQASRLIGWRVAQGLTQAQAGALLGVSGAAWSSWETRAKRPGVSNAIGLAELTGAACPIEGWRRFPKAEPRPAL